MTKLVAIGWMSVLALASGCGNSVPGRGDADSGIAPDGGGSVIRGATTLSLSAGHVCALRPDGRVACWGANQNGQSRPDRRTVLETQPTIVDGLPEIRQVATGYDHSCAIDAAGGAWCWGANTVGQLGDGTDLDARAPRAVVGVANADRLALGTDFSCAMATSGSWFCWGAGGADNFERFHREALGVQPDDGASTAHFAPLATGANEIQFGTYVGCLRSRTSVQCWGWDRGPRPFELPATDDVTQIAVGDLSLCALRRGGRVTCWSNPTSEATLFEITSATEFTSVVAVSGDGYCGLRSSGATTCWSARERTPVETRLPASVAIFGGRNLCARGADARLRCMVVSDNKLGQLGDAVPHLQIEPVTVLDVSDAVALSSDILVTNVVTRGGEVRWWGAALFDVDTSRPARLGDLDRVVEMKGRCVRRSDGSVACRRDIVGPVRIAELTGPSDNIEIAAGGQWIVGRTSGRRIRCLEGDCALLEGVDDVEQVVASNREIFARLGDGSVRALLTRIAEGTRTSETVIVPVELPEPAEFIAAGDGCSCARLRSQQVACWGLCGVAAPVQGAEYRGIVRAELTGARSLGVSSSGICFVDADGAVRCTNAADDLCTESQTGTRCTRPPIGGALYGRFASGTNDLRVSMATPIARGAVSVIREGDHACALMADGRVQCWGDASRGELGDGRRAIPGTIVDLPSQD